MRLLCAAIVVKLPDGESLEGMAAVLVAGVTEARDGVCRAHRDFCSLMRAMDTTQQLGGGTIRKTCIVSLGWLHVPPRELPSFLFSFFFFWLELLMLRIASRQGRWVDRDE